MIGPTYVSLSKKKKLPAQEQTGFSFQLLPLHALARVGSPVMTLIAQAKQFIGQTIKKETAFLSFMVSMYLIMPMMTLAQPDTVYFESFTNQTGKGYDNVTGYDLTNVSWSADASGCPNAATFSVQNTNGFVFEASDLDGGSTAGATGYWYSPQVEITGKPLPFISAYLSHNNASFGPTDSMQLAYSVDGGSFITVATLTGTFPFQDVATAIPSGDSVQIRVAINNNSNLESHYIDHVLVGDSTVCTQANSVSGAAVSEQYRRAFLSWTNPFICSDEILILASETSVTFSPSGNGISYIAYSNYGNGMEVSPGEFIVYKGNGDTTSVTGLTRNKQYFFKIFSREGTMWDTGVEVNLMTTSLIDTVIISSEGNCFGPDLFISEYLEGSLNDKAIELFNPTNSPITLTGNYSIRFYQGGQTTFTSTPLTGVIQPDSTFVIAYSGATSPAIVNIANQTMSSNFTGDDALALFKGSDTLDIIGVIGVDPGAAWTVTGVNGVNGETRDFTLVRDSIITQGQLDWSVSSTSEWKVYPLGTVSYLGNHQFGPCPGGGAGGNCSGPDLFISEYMEGPINDKAIELFNPTGSPITLTGNYSIRFYQGGQTTFTATPLTGVIQPDSTFVIAYSGATSPSIVNIADQTMSSNFTGDDALALFKGSDTLDIIGVIGVDPGAAWAVMGINGVNGETRDFTLVRDSIITQGQLDWSVSSTSEWKVYPNGTVSYLGNHQFGPCPGGPAGCSGPDLFISEYMEGSLNDKYIEIYNPTGSQVTLTSNYSIRYYQGGQTTFTATALSGVIEPDSTFILAYSGATSPTIVNIADQTMSSNFTGDDAIALFKGTDTLDVIGVIGVDPGAAWTVTGTNGVNGETRNNTLQREWTVKQGQTNWSVGSATEWEVYPVQTISNINIHYLDCNAPPPVEWEVVYSGGPLDFGLQAINNPAVMSYELSPTNIYEDVEIIAPFPYQVSLVPNGLFKDTLTIFGGLSGNTTIYVKFEPVAIGVFNDSIRHTTSGADTIYAVVTGEGYDPYPYYTIDQINDVDGNGVADSLGVQLSLSGVVYGVNLNPGGLQFTLIDPTGGISVFHSSQSLGYTVLEGDSISVFGTIAQTNGLLEIIPDSIFIHQSVIALKMPLIITDLDESTESDLIRLENFYLANPAQWTNTGSAFDVEITNYTDTFTMRIDDDVDIYGQPAPATYFNVTGIGSQNDPAPPYDDGYLIYPRYQPDIEPISPVLTITNGDTLKFGSVFVGDTSVVLAYIIEGHYLLQNTTVTAPAGFELSLDSTTFSGSVMMNRDSAGNLTDTVYVRFIPTAPGAVLDSANNVSDTSAMVYFTALGIDPYPAYTIGAIDDLDPNGVADSLGINCALYGIVYGVNLEPAGLQFTLRDAIGGIAVYNAAGSLGYTVLEGDSIMIKGTIGQNNGLLEIHPDSLELLSGGHTLKTPTLVTMLDEATESDLVSIEEVYLIDPLQWTNAGSGFNVDISNHTDTFVMRIDADVNIFGQPAPAGYFNVTGIGSQNDATSPYDEDYLIMPRYLTDITDLPSSLSITFGNSLNFGNVPQFDTSASQYFVVEGDYLLNDVDFTTSAEFPISFSATNGFTNALTISPVAGMVNDTIYVKFAPTLITSYVDSVVVTIGGVQVDKADVSGNGIDPYPDYTINQVNGTNPDGEADSLNVPCQLNGIVYGVNLEPAGLEFTLIDATGGISVFNGSQSFGYSVQEGDSVSVSGTISQADGLLQIMADTVEFFSAGHPLKTPLVVTTLNESTESDLVKLENVELVTPSQWQTSGGTFDVDITDGVNNYTLRIDENVDIYGQPAPVAKFHVTGIGSQEDPNLPYLDGYMIVPRYQADIEEWVGISEAAATETFSIYPNPVSDELYIESHAAFTGNVVCNIYSMKGELVKTIEQPANGLSKLRLDVSNLLQGAYVLQIQHQQKIERSTFMINR